MTDEAVLQAGLTAESESAWRLETNAKVLPKEGDPGAAGAAGEMTRHGERGASAP